MSKKEEKTNVMRVLDQKKIPYTPHTYPHGAGDTMSLTSRWRPPWT